MARLRLRLAMEGEIESTNAGRRSYEEEWQRATKGRSTSKTSTQHTYPHIHTPTRAAAQQEQHTTTIPTRTTRAATRTTTHDAGEQTVVHIDCCILNALQPRQTGGRQASRSTTTIQAVNKLHPMPCPMRMQIRRWPPRALHTTTSAHRKIASPPTAQGSAIDCAHKQPTVNASAAFNRRQCEYCQPCPNERPSNSLKHKARQHFTKAEQLQPPAMAERPSEVHHSTSSSNTINASINTHPRATASKQSSQHATPSASDGGPPKQQVILALEQQKRRIDLRKQQPALPDPENYLRRPDSIPKTQLG
ncbi:uncharacterized protein MYCGRDRAFT_96142 [Zymoseptoria tritici IPO323]|uniref:Uncharacterized protein n=1 Tax=Zymoseptoria tritici (strain CBS 115943 / IPO323) TaxID=336722 RepID=F9XLL0_ZYMTI|nr:uncharacterized protein MYCGRDRAFT_96142 [Zymoseptoria tritici IPO323]EGP83796.1 hypothetical protein MYCGRDRAFT_96142 [Zymoseptoria tritici IPO323]